LHFLVATLGAGGRVSWLAARGGRRGPGVGTRHRLGQTACQPAAGLSVWQQGLLDSNRVAS